MKTSSVESAVTPDSGGRPPGPLPASEESLTRREREVLSCFAEGLDTDSVAKRLSISRVTVRNHTQRILGKLRVHSRLAAVARGYREGLIGQGGVMALSRRGAPVLTPKARSAEIDAIPEICDVSESSHQAMSSPLPDDASSSLKPEVIDPSDPGFAVGSLEFSLVNTRRAPGEEPWHF